MPDGVVNVLTSRKSGAVVSAMLNDPRVRKLSFTGSTEVGRILLREAADTVVNCSMELGGNAPFIIFEDADIDAAVEGALIAKMRNGGEACTAANRFYVHEAVADEFSRTFAARLDRMVVGPGLEEGTDVGPLVNEPTRTKVAELVESATADGGKVVTGGRAPDRRGYFYQPTVIDQLPADAGILGTEIFGPVAPVVRFTAEADAVSWANDTEFGLVSYVYTRDLSRGLRVSEALEAGMVGLNRGLVSDPAAPFGGVKQSGIGREGAHEGLLEFTETKYIATDWLSSVLRLTFYAGRSVAHGRRGSAGPGRKPLPKQDPHRFHAVAPGELLPGLAATCPVADRHLVGPDAAPEQLASDLGLHAEAGLPDAHFAVQR